VPIWKRSGTKRFVAYLEV